MLDPTAENIKTAYDKINAAWDKKDKPTVKEPWQHDTAESSKGKMPDSIVHGEEVNTNPTKAQQEAENYQDG